MNRQLGSLEARLEDAKINLEEQKTRAREIAESAAKRELELREEIANTREDHLRRMEEIQTAASQAQKEAHEEMEENFAAHHNEMERRTYSLFIGP